MKQGRFFRTVIAINRFRMRGWTCAVDEPDEPTVFIGSHQNMHGPLTILTMLPFVVHIWALHVFMDWRSCYRQYADYTFSKRFGMPKPIACTCAFICAGVVSALVRSAAPVPVYRKSARVSTTFRVSMGYLAQGEHLLIFPDVEYSQAREGIGEIYDGFVMLGKLYGQSTGKSLRFVPLYCDDADRRIVQGDPVVYDIHANIRDEKARIGEALRDSINRMSRQTR